MKRSSGGYTLVEVMAAIAIMGAGLLGIISLQGAAVAANSRANQITIATNLARRWQDRLRRGGGSGSDRRSHDRCEGQDRDARVHRCASAHQHGSE